MNESEWTRKHNANLPQRPKQPTNIAQEVQHAIGLPADDSQVLALNDVQTPDLVQMVRVFITGPVAVRAWNQVTEIGVEEVYIGGLSPLEVRCGV